VQQCAISSNIAISTHIRDDGHVATSRTCHQTAKVAAGMTWLHVRGDKAGR
jgi:hypothetical protein